MLPVSINQKFHSTQCTIHIYALTYTSLSTKKSVFKTFMLLLTHLISILKLSNWIRATDRKRCIAVDGLMIIIYNKHREEYNLPYLITCR